MLSAHTQAPPVLFCPARSPRHRCPGSAGCAAHGPVVVARCSRNVSVAAPRHVCRVVETNALAADWGDWVDVLDEADEALTEDRAELPPVPPGEAERVYLVGAELKDKARARKNALPLEESLAELAALSETAGLKVVGRTVQRLGAFDRRTFIGSGKVQEVLEHARALQVDTIIFDEELSPSQARNIERLTGGTDIRVADRTALILDVFSTRAATAEGRLQTQLAQVLYQLPRLTRMWTHLERQSGSGQVKGAGEAQLEIDKRLLREQAARLRLKIEDVRRHREVYRQRRAEASVPILTLVGYTSAGKSQLLNKLTDAAVLSDSMLFATLDPTTRRCQMPSGHGCLITDTVGFVQKLPTQLVAAFRATLEEVQEASVLIHVVDASHADFRPYVDAVLAVLAELEVAHIPMVILWNKIDIAADPERLRREAKLQKVTVCASALTGEGLDDLWRAVQELTDQQLVQMQVLLPFDQANLVSDIRRHGILESEEFTEDGVLVKAKVPLFISQRLGASGTRVA